MAEMIPERAEYIAKLRTEFEAAHPKRECVPLTPAPNYDQAYWDAMAKMD